ncbi:hypothetical protein ACLOJK_013917 [Asimina triloba]
MWAKWPIELITVCRQYSHERQPREYIKRCMGGGANDVLLFCGSGTTAAIKRLQEMMGIAVPSTLRERVIRSLMRNEERWVVFVGPYEHHSNLLSWRQSLAEVVEIGCNSEGQVDMDAIKHALESSEYSNRPMLGSFSACSNVTGMHADTRAISRLLHQHGAFACFDFAASGPYAKIDMRSGEEDGYDGIFLSPHKFVGGPGSPGILLVSKALYQLQSSPPTTCGGGTVAYANGFNEKDTLYYDDIEEREDAGTPPIVQKIRAALAFWIKEFMGYGLISSLDTKHIELALERLLPNPNIHVLGNTGVRRHSILSFLVFSRPATSFFNNMKRESPGGGGKSLLWRDIKSNADMPLHGRFVAKLLNDLFGIQARGGCACSGPYGHRLLNVDKTLSLGLRSAIQRGYGGVKPGWTRVSFPFYMSTEEVEFIAAAIELVAEYGHCFLPLYRFNWRSGDWSFRKSMHSVVSMLLRSKEHSNLSTGISQLTVHPARDRSDASVNEKNNGRDYNAGLSKKHALYLETARNIVDALPEFPLARKVPKDIDLSIVLFRI